MSKSDAKIATEKLTEIKSSPNDILGLDYARYKQAMYALSLTTPAAYFAMRETISTELTEDIVTSIYNKIYLLLREGKIAGKSVVDGKYPGFPSNKCNEMSLSVASSLESFLNECIEIILPANYLSLSANKMIAQTNAI